MSDMAIRPGPDPTRRVRVWFGETPIANYCADALSAARYADAMGRRFAGLKVTNEPIATATELRPLPPAEAAELRPLPPERTWDVIPPH